MRSYQITPERDDEDEARDRAAEEARDDAYARDVHTLACVFRSRYPQALRKNDRKALAGVLRDVADRLAAPLSHDEAIVFAFELWGPDAILLALKQAYDSPDLLVSDVVEHE